MTRYFIFVSKKVKTDTGPKGHQAPVRVVKSAALGLLRVRGLGDFHDAYVEVHLHSLLDGAEDLG